jgi:uncharacterized protein YecA (UPF0149 family)
MILRLAKKLFERDADPPETWGRNNPCWCGSGKKYKACHQERDEERRVAARAAACRGAT